MPRLKAATPKYRHHRASGQAVITIAGKDHYLGPWKSKASKVEYDRLIGEWLTAGRPSARPAAQAEITIAGTNMLARTETLGKLRVERAAIENSRRHQSNSAARCRGCRRSESLLSGG